MYNVLKYIHEHLNEKLNVAEVAEFFNFSKWHFIHSFKKFTGCSFVEYVRRYRLQTASIDILNGEKVLDVAIKYGYDTPSGFNRAFLKEFGCLPRQYKKQAKECSLYYERRKISMYKLSDRCELLREEVVNNKQFMKNYGVQRMVYFLLGLSENLDKGSLDEVNAGGLTRVIDSFTPCIAPGELIVGFNFSDDEYTEKYIPDEKDREIMKKNCISDEDIQKYLDRKVILNKWGLESVDEAIIARTKEEQEYHDEWSSIGRSQRYNHTVLNYEKVLKFGFEGLLKEVEEYISKNGENSFYRSLVSICKSALKMGEKYVEKAKELLDNPEYNKEDLQKIIEVCSNVPRHPATTFCEAVQSLYFAHILNTWEDAINANSLGRLDKILYPYYINDINKGLITKEEAFEIICCLWIKLYRDYDVQQSCVGGTSPDGSCDVNELSYMMLDATERLDFIRCMSVRWSENTPPEFMKRALEVVGHVQKGVPFFFNDDVMVPALISKGISPEDAYNYTQIGCVETVIPGKSNPHAVAGETNILKAIEYVLCNGVSMMHPELAPGAKTGELNSFTTYEKFYDAVKIQVEKIVDCSCRVIKKSEDAIVCPKPYKTLLTEGCLESGRDFNDKGAKYDYYQVMLGGIPNLADSLAVIKKFVYEEKKYTLSEIKEILQNNYPDETVRLEFLNKAPKFGNDIDEVDNIAVDILDYCCDVLDACEEKYGLPFHAQPFTYLWMIDHGRHSAASPDGRRAGEPIAYSVSPMQGRDFRGFSALLNSLSKFHTKRTPGTTSAIVEVDPALFTDNNIDKFTAAMMAAGKKGLQNVQFNIADAETLMDAQKHPEKHKNLAVRVSGFSQKFNILGKELQDHIIERTKHKSI